MASSLLALACEYQLHPSIAELEVGDCVRGGVLGEVEKVEHIDCSEPDALRVTSKFEVSGYGSWPGYFELQRIAAERCPGNTVAWLVPIKEGWDKAGDRGVLCFEEVG